MVVVCDILKFESWWERALALKDFSNGENQKPGAVPVRKALPRQASASLLLLTPLGKSAA